MARWVMVTMIAFGCDPGSLGNPDAGPPATDMAQPAFAFELATETDCRDLALDHSEEPLFGFVAYGPPNSRAEIFASRPQCGVTPFFFAGFDIDETGRGEALYNHPGNENCDDNLLGAWEVFALVRTARTDSVPLYFENSSCAQPRCGEPAMETHCPP